MSDSLSYKFREIKDETKALILKSACESFDGSSLDADEIAANIKMMMLFDRLMDLCADMFERQEELMDKMNRAMDKYLEN